MSNQVGITRMLPGIRNVIRVAESFAVGLPLRHYAPKSRAAEDYQLFTDSVVDLGSVNYQKSTKLLLTKPYSKSYYYCCYHY